jgi:hypothetical protein
VVFLAAAIPTRGRRILTAVHTGDGLELLVFAAGTRSAAALSGALLFYASDAPIAWTRFIADVR